MVKIVRWIGVSYVNVFEWIYYICDGVIFDFGKFEIKKINKLKNWCK